MNKQIKVKMNPDLNYLQGTSLTCSTTQWSIHWGKVEQTPEQGSPDVNAWLAHGTLVPAGEDESNEERFADLFEGNAETFTQAEAVSMAKRINAAMQSRAIKINGDGGKLLEQQEIIDQIVAWRNGTSTDEDTGEVSVLDGMNVKDAAAYIAEIETIDELETLLAAEVASQDRKGVKDAINARKEAIEATANGGTE